MIFTKKRRNENIQKSGFKSTFISFPFINYFMVFGFGRGKIELILEKYNYSPGNTIKGKISLKLKKPIQAKALKVGLVGEKVTKEFRRTSGKGARSTPRKTNLFDFEMSLDGEREYLKGEYKFKIKIPENVLQTPKGDIGNIIKGIQLLSGKDIRISWYVTAKLDIPSGFDISKKIQINIG